MSVLPGRVFPATEQNKQRAIQYILGLRADGGTNINQAVLDGITVAENARTREQLNKETKSMIVFLTDGLPSTGVTDGDTIKKNIRAANTGLGSSIFCIGFGRDADFALIRDISAQADAFSKRIYEGSDAALQLEDFYAEISSPVVSGLQFQYVGEVENSSLTEPALSTFYRGGEILVTGRLAGERLTVKVTGQGAEQAYQDDMVFCLDSSQQQPELSSLPFDCLLPPTFPPRSQAQTFLQRLHAFQNIKQILGKIETMKGEEMEVLKTKVLELALANNFVTELTSLVVTEQDEDPKILELKPAEEENDFDYYGLAQSSFASFGVGPVSAVSLSYYESDYDDYDYQESSVSNKVPSPVFTSCSGNLTLYSKTYHRGDNITLAGDAEDLAVPGLQFDNTAVTAELAGDCCWILYSEAKWLGENKRVRPEKTYTSVSSLDTLFREVSSVRKINC